MKQFINSYKKIIALQLLVLTGCGGGSGPSITNNTPSGNRVNNTVDADNVGETNDVNETNNGPQLPVSEIEIEHDNDFSFQPDTGSRADKVIGFFEFTLRDITNNRFVRNLNNSNMTFKERPLGSEEPFNVEVEATQSSDIEVTPINVMYLIDTSFSVVQAGANAELTKQASNLANEINNRNSTSDAATDSVRFRTFADKVSSLQTTTADTPFNQIQFEERGGGTALYEGIDLSLADLATSAQPVLFVFTDGRENASSPGYNLDVVLNSAVNYNIPIYIAGLGNVDASILNQIATTSGGQFFQAESVDQLSDVFEDILYSIPALYTVSYRPTQRAGHTEFQFEVDYGSAVDMIPGDFNVDEILNNNASTTNQANNTSATNQANNTSMTNEATNEANSTATTNQANTTGMTNEAEDSSTANEADNSNEL